MSPGLKVASEAEASCISRGGAGLCHMNSKPAEDFPVCVLCVFLLPIGRETPRPLLTAIPCKHILIASEDLKIAMFTSAHLALREPREGWCGSFNFSHSGVIDTLRWIMGLFWFSGMFSLHSRSSGNIYCSPRHRGTLWYRPVHL